MRSISRSSVILTNVLTAACLFSYYLPTLAKGVTFSDGPEITTAIVTLGVIHPTGYPLFTILAHWFVRLVPTPFEPCYEVALMNAILATISGLIVATSVRTLVEHLMPSRDPFRSRNRDLWGLVGGALAAIFLGFSPLLWHQVRIPEVYPLHVLLVSWAVHRWIRYEVGGRRSVDVLWTAIPMGLGLAHHVTMVYMLPAAFVLVLTTRPAFFLGWLVAPVIALRRRLGKDSPRLSRWSVERPWCFPLACVVGALPLPSYYYLIWANEHTTGIPWGGVEDWDTLYAHVSGAAYRGYMKGLGFSGIPRRLEQLPDTFYEVLFFPGMAFALLGLSWLSWRRRRLLLFLLMLACGLIIHGLQYDVGDYRNYFLPAMVVVALLAGLGCTRLAIALDGHGLGISRRWRALTVVALGTAAVLVIFDVGVMSVQFEKLLDPTERIVWAVSLGAGALGLAAWPYVRRKPALVFGYRASAFALTGLLVLLTLSVGVLRAEEVSRRPLVGQNHARSVARELPKGALYMTMSDGFIFSQWYQLHVMGEPMEAAIINIRRVGRNWYKEYLRTRFPATCDPLHGDYADDAAAWQEHCGSFEKRKATSSKRSWYRLTRNDFRSGRVAPRDESALAEYGLEHLLTNVVGGTHSKCSRKDYRKKNVDRCRCWNTDVRAHEVDEWCVPSMQEGGIVALALEEIYARRLVQDHIDVRPVFERNVYTRWMGKKSPRKWDGPGHQRPSREYTMVNRGRSNQIVYTKDLVGHDVCGNTQLERVVTPTLSPPKSLIPSRGVDRPPFIPSDWPVLIDHTFLSPRASRNSDHGTTSFRVGDTIHWHVDWFEGWHYDAELAERRGKAFSHGVRLCAFDSSGNRVWTGTTRSGSPKPKPIKIPTRPEFPLGTYVLQACSVGEVESDEDFAGRPCVRPILEYEFTLDAP